MEKSSEKNMPRDVCYAVVQVIYLQITIFFIWKNNALSTREGIAETKVSWST